MDGVRYQRRLSAFRLLRQFAVSVRFERIVCLLGTMPNFRLGALCFRIRTYFICALGSCPAAPVNNAASLLPMGEPMPVQGSGPGPAS